MLQQSSSLDDLAARFSLLHHKVKEATRLTLAAAFDAGDILIEARRQISNGGWFQWLRRHRIPLSTAKLYVQLAQHRSTIEAEMDRLGDLSVRAARKLITARASRASSSSRSDRKTDELAEALQQIAKLQAELTRLKAARSTLDRPSQLFAKAVLLAKWVCDPNTGKNDIESGRNEAITALNMIYAMLLAEGVDINDVAISASKGTTQQRRKAA